MLALMFVIWLSHSPPSSSTYVCIRYSQVVEHNYINQFRRSTCSLSLERVGTESAREEGLSGRESLPSGRGMLLVFDNIGRKCIWMKDMKFSLDVVWLDGEGNVVKLEENLAPSTYPNEYCAEDSLFVIEVGAGTAKISGLSVGSHVDL